MSNLPNMSEIRAVLGSAEHPMKQADIVEALGLTTAPEKHQLYTMVSSGCVTGWITRHASSDGLSYSLNPTWTPKRHGRPAGNVKTRQQDAGEGRRVVSPKPDCAPESVALHAPTKPSDFDLRIRLCAIGDDLVDAIRDACDAEHPHALIKALVASREAVNVAQKALPPR